MRIKTTNKTIYRVQRIIYILKNSKKNIFNLDTEHYYTKKNNQMNENLMTRTSLFTYESIKLYNLCHSHSRSSRFE